MFLNTVDIHNEANRSQGLDKSVHPRSSSFYQSTLMFMLRHEKYFEGIGRMRDPLKPYLLGYRLQVVVCVAEG